MLDLSLLITAGFGDIQQLILGQTQLIPN